MAVALGRATAAAATTAGLSARVAQHRSRSALTACAACAQRWSTSISAPARASPSGVRAQHTSALRLDARVHDEHEDDSSAPAAVARYGQALPRTHPHLFMRSDELTPGIPASDYEQRRKRLMAEMEDGAVVVLASGRIKYMSRNIFYKFRQESNFWYLTGWEEPDSALVLQKDSSARGYRMTFFAPPRASLNEPWDGPSTSLEDACAIFGADDALETSRLPSWLDDLFKSDQLLAPVYVDVPADATVVSPPRGGGSSFRTDSGRRNGTSFLDQLAPSARANAQFDAALDVLRGYSSRSMRSASHLIEKMRLVKSENEIAVMRRAADASAQAHGEVMRFAGSERGKTEASLVAHFEYQTTLRGGSRPAYVPVCAGSGGDSLLTIHYTRNDRPLRSGDLVLLDAGCEMGGYASDITRTFPVDGKFSSAQRDLYEAVLAVEKACVAMVAASSSSPPSGGIASWLSSGFGTSTSVASRNGPRSLDELHRASVDLTRRELRQLGFDPVRALSGTALERVLYPHFLTHPLGIDLHDTPSFRRHEPIEAGMVITIEPGVYVPPDDRFPKAFHNMAVRIEDEVLVRQDDCVVLSVDAPKEVADVEATCQNLF